jgi:hypothetical protein
VAAQIVRLVVSVETGAPGGASGGTLLGYAIVDQAGVIAASGATRVAGGRHAFSTTVAPGRYTLRVGGIDPLGRRGLVQRDFIAALPDAAGVRVSDLILAPVPARPELPLEPLIDRIDDVRVASYLELYASDTEPLAGTTVSFEIAATDSAAPLVTIPAAVTRQGERWATARGILTLGVLAPGSYVASARVLRDGRELARVSRPFTRTIRTP